MALGLGRGKERREGRGWGAELRRNNRPKGEFFLFPPPLPFCPPLQTEICEAVCADGRKARTLNWTKPPQPLLGRRGYPASVAICQKKKKGKKEKGRRRRGGVGGKKNMNHFSQELGVGCASTSGWQYDGSGVVEKELTARSKSEFLDEGGNSSTSVATVCCSSSSCASSRIESAITWSNCLRENKIQWF